MGIVASPLCACLHVMMLDVELQVQLKPQFSSDAVFLMCNFASIFGCREHMYEGAT